MQHDVGAAPNVAGEASSGMIRLGGGAVAARRTTLPATRRGVAHFDAAATDPGPPRAAMRDVVPPRARASAVGLMATVGFAGAGLSPLLSRTLGEIVGLDAAFSLIAVLYIAAVLLSLLSRQIVISDIDDTDRIVAGRGELEEQIA